ncbi:MAG: TspO/MBR family protein [Hyphomonas sp.]
MQIPENLLALAVFMAINFAAASSGAIFRPGTWYAGLSKPPWTPPNLAFPVVWTILFVLNALSGWLVWIAGGADAAGALAIYGVSLVINASWSGVFFGLRRMLLGLWVVLALWLSIAAVILTFSNFSTPAALMQLPYLVWVTIAAALNLSVWRRNPAERQPA